MAARPRRCRKPARNDLCPARSLERAQVFDNQAPPGLGALDAALGSPESGLVGVLVALFLAPVVIGFTRRSAAPIVLGALAVAACSMPVAMLHASSSPLLPYNRAQYLPLLAVAFVQGSALAAGFDAGGWRRKALFGLLPVLLLLTASLTVHVASLELHVGAHVEGRLRALEEIAPTLPPGTLLAVMADAPGVAGYPCLGYLVKTAAGRPFRNTDLSVIWRPSPRSLWETVGRADLGDRGIQVLEASGTRYVPHGPYLPPAPTEPVEITREGDVFRFEPPPPGRSVRALRLTFARGQASEAQLVVEQTRGLPPLRYPLNVPDSSEREPSLMLRLDEPAFLSSPRIRSVALEGAAWAPASGVASAVELLDELSVIELVELDPVTLSGRAASVFHLARLPDWAGPLSVHFEAIFGHVRVPVDLRVRRKRFVPLADGTFAFTPGPNDRASCPLHGQHTGWDELRACFTDDLLGWTGSHHVLARIELRTPGRRYLQAASPWRRFDLVLSKSP